MTEIYTPPEPDPRARLYSPKGFEVKPKPKPEDRTISPNDEIVRAVAAAARMLGQDGSEFADSVWGKSPLSVTEEQRHKFLRPDKTER